MPRGKGMWRVVSPSRLGGLGERRSPGRKRVFVYLELENTHPIATNMSFLTLLHLIAERYITSSQGRPQFSVGRPVDREGRPWPTRPKPKTATGGYATIYCPSVRLSVNPYYLRNIIKLRTSNFVRTLIRWIATKAD